MGRRLLLFAFLVLVFALAAPPGPSVGNKPINHGGAGQVNKTVQPVARAVEQQAVEPALYKHPCGNSPEDRQSDLCAQWKAADWTKWGVLVGIFGTLALLYQIKLTREALEDTGKATAAMERQNQLSEDTAERQLRAYVTTEDHDVIGFWRGGPATLRTKIYNRGQSPAYDLKIWSIVGGTLEEPDDFKVKQIKKEGFRQSSAMLGPGQWILHCNGCQSPLNGDAYVGIVHGQIKLIFGGVVSYRDIFGRRHFTIFKQFYTGHGDWGEQSSDLLCCGRHNNGN